MGYCARWFSFLGAAHVFRGFWRKARMSVRKKSRRVFVRDKRVQTGADFVAAREDEALAAASA